MLDSPSQTILAVDHRAFLGVGHLHALDVPDHRRQVAAPVLVLGLAQQPALLVVGVQRP